MLHASYPGVPIYACGTDIQHAAALEAAGASTTVVTAMEVRGHRWSSSLAA